MSSGANEKTTLELRLVDRIDAVAQADWDALVRDDDSPFVEHTWLSTLEESGCVGGDSGWTPCHLTLYEHDKLVAAAPTYVKTGSEGEFVFDWSWAEVAHRLGVRYYPKLVTAVPFTPATGGRVLVDPKRSPDERAAFVRTVARAVGEIVPDLGVSGAHVLFPRADELALWEDAGFAPRYGVQFHWKNQGYATFEDFLKSLPSKKRTQLRREAKQPEKDGVVIETLAPEAYTHDVVKAMFELYLTTVDKFVWGRQYLNRRFFELLVARFRHRLAWVVARKEGRIVAGAFNVKKNDRLYGRYWGTFVDLPFLHFNVCYYHGIRQCIAEHLTVFEPGAGGEHKRARGFVPTVTYSGHKLADPRLRAVIEPHLARERAAILAHVAEDSGEDEMTEP